MNLHLHSHAVTLGNGIEIVVKNVQSFQQGYRLDVTAMDAITQSQYISSDVSRVLFDQTSSVESMLHHPTVLEIINSKSFITYYRTVIPFFWVDEWILIIIDTMTYSVHFVHPLYSNDITNPSTSDERCALNVFLKGHIEAILQTSTGVEYTSGKWKFHLSLEENGRVTVIDGTQTVVYNNEDSGLYILFAMECDYFDSPIFAPDHTHWSNFRTRMAYCLLNRQLLF